MRTRLLVNLVLLLIVTGLALFLSRTTNDETEQLVPISSVEPGKINNIKITRRDLEDISFIKQGDNWLMQAPYEIVANKIRINSMLRLLQAHSYAQLGKHDVELDRFLLDDPVVSIQFDDTRIDFGDSSPLDKNERRYVLLGNTIHLINDSLYQQLQTNASFFISPGLLPAGSNITALQFPEHRVHMENNIWQIDPSLDISADDIISLVTAWQDAEAITVRKFIETDQDKKIIVELDNAQPIIFIIATPPPTLVLARPEFNVQYHISSYEADRLFPEKYSVSAQQANSTEESGQ